MKKLIMGFLLLLPRLILGQNLPTSITTSTALSPETLSIPSISSTANINVVREWAFKVPIELILSNPTKEQALTTTYYTDGLGKPLQEVFYQVSPTGKDLVRPFVYDAYGRSKYGLSPYPSTTNSGKIVQTPGSSYNSRLSTIYSSEANFFERISYENSPVGKVLKNSAPGNSWSGSNKGVTVFSGVGSSAYYVR
ncbi:DUF6443 domain-containing protein [Algoriphagus yeomjeoni]|uniref:DUF6443 domain-containing protein n=1 Tax=Algoriphagus yeomjeoni TaxID=291403 RepID=A0A327P6Z5_9BACT|nr:DUF6443 domain-containing protein [Algoriphagus yeomjeoni]RAI86692.1 hypothetical protein LV83_03248 [Algoriphagus yeomjeoni]